MPSRIELSELERLERAASVLSPFERELLVLSAGHRLRNSEIAARLAISERRVERSLARALRKLDRAIGKRPRSSWQVW